MFFIERRQTRRFFLPRGDAFCAPQANLKMGDGTADHFAGFAPCRFCERYRLILGSALIAVFPTARPATFFGVDTGALVDAFVK